MLSLMFESVRVDSFLFGLIPLLFNQDCQKERQKERLPLISIRWTYMIGYTVNSL